MKVIVRRLILLLFVVGVAAAILFGMMPTAVEADLAKVVRGAVRETVDQDGKTRLRERYIVSAPLAGRLLRIGLDPGDPVVAGDTLLASIEPRDPELLDSRTLLQAEANVNAAEARLRQAKPLLEEATANKEFADAELKRARDARAGNPAAITAADLENKQMFARGREAMVRSAQHAVEIAQFELDQARAALVRSRPPEENGNAAQEATGAATGEGATESAANGAPYPNRDDSWHFTIRSPINGRVLRVFQESSAVVTPGTNLLEIGDPRDLEVEIDVLSRDAVKIHPDAEVSLEHWGGDKPLEGRVRLVEPSGFTKISTLGVEEQRVNVIVDLIDPPVERTALGDGFRVEARIVVAEAEDVIKAPTSALYRAGDEWAVFRVEKGVARQQIVKVGLQNGLEAEILDGLAKGDEVVTHPGDDVADGVAVKPR